MFFVFCGRVAVGADAVAASALCAIESRVREFNQLDRVLRVVWKCRDAYADGDAKRSIFKLSRAASLCCEEMFFDA